MLIATLGAPTVDELQSCRVELTRLREAQAATREILALIAQVQDDAQPVFERITDAALRLCDATQANVATFDGSLLHLKAQAHARLPGDTEPDLREAVRRLFPRPPGRDLALTRAVLTGRRVVIPDVRADPDFSPEIARLGSAFSVIGIPMLRDGRPIGALAVGRSTAGPFPDEQVALLESFAEQATIAIENLRLFNETKEALDQQKASAEVLQVISSSVADTKPVFDKILETCQRLFEGRTVWINLVGDDGAVHLAAYKGPDYDAFASIYPLPLTYESGSGTAILEKRIAHYPDVEHGPNVPVHARSGCALIGVKSVLVAPMLWESRGIGAIFVGRASIGEFSDKEVWLLKSFAGQATIAIQNARLFNALESRNREVSSALEQQTATSEILRVISRSPTDVQPVFDAIAAAALSLCRARSTNVLIFDGHLLHLAARASPTGDADEAAKVFPRPASADTVAGRAVLTRRVAVIPDITEDPDYAEDALRLAQVNGSRSFLGVPLMRDGSPIGALGVGRPEVGPIPEQQIALLQTFADQAVIALENVRLFNELREKGLQLELASRHKSQFLANMSHELRTPLNAIIGFTRIVMRHARDALEPKQYDNLVKILASAQHLLALINAVLDLSKIEAGHVEVRASEVALRPVLEQCLLTIEPLVRSDAVTVVADMDAAPARVLVDEEKLRQIVLNLLSNAVKFTERGSIRLRATATDSRVTIAVADTGIGIPPDKLSVVFDEFEQADASSTRLYGGTGLGLAIARRLARLMGGDILAQSTSGSGSTFTLALPLRYRPGAEGPP